MSGTWPANGPIPPDPGCPCLHCRSIPRPEPEDLFEALAEFSEKWGSQFPPKQEGGRDGR